MKTPSINANHDACARLAAPSGSPFCAMRESLDMNPPSAKEAKLLLKALLWDVDMVIRNHDGERVWLRPYLNAEGKRIGITDCCLETDPCEQHLEMVNQKLRHGENSQ